jgi:transcription antitermination protein NusB
VARYAEKSLGRQLAFQFLFSLEFMDTPWEQALPEFWRMQPVSLTNDGCDDDEMPVAERAFLEKASPAKAEEYANELIQGVCELRKELDDRITTLLDNYKPERVGRIEWVITRLALYELLHGARIPDTVVIAEAVQLANCFGDPDSPRFVNGLLNQLASADVIPPDEEET